jgi:hypothetical protein
MRMLGAIVVMVALSGCDQGSKTAAMPAVVQQMVAAEFPADGEIHVQNRGVFVVKPDTMFCRDRNGFGLDTDQLRQLFERLGQPKTVGSYFRGNGKIGVDEECSRNNPIFVSGTQINNRNGAQYKLVLAAWQGGAGGAAPTAVWVGGVERGREMPRADATLNRLNPSTNPRLFGKTIEEQKADALFNSSLELDQKDLSKEFLLHISGEVK